MRLQDYPFVRDLRKKVNDKAKWASIYKEIKKLNLNFVDNKQKELRSAFVWFNTPQGHNFWSDLNSQYHQQVK